MLFFFGAIAFTRSEYGESAIILWLGLKKAIAFVLREWAIAP
jgi:hypothetical protein